MKVAESSCIQEQRITCGCQDQHLVFGNPMSRCEKPWGEAQSLVEIGAHPKLLVCIPGTWRNSRHDFGSPEANQKAKLGFLRSYKLAMGNGAPCFRHKRPSPRSVLLPHSAILRCCYTAFGSFLTFTLFTPHFLPSRTGNSTVNFEPICRRP